MGDVKVDCLRRGRAAEHIAVADMILSGYDATLTEQGMPYDAVLDVGGKLLRVQVKSTTGPVLRSAGVAGAAPRYVWNVKATGKANKKKIKPDAFDVLALVALDTKRVAYIPFHRVKAGASAVILYPLGEAPVRSRLAGWSCTMDKLPLSAAIADDPEFYAALANVTRACLRGHLYTPENTAVRSGGRVCLACERAYHKHRAGKGPPLEPVRRAETRKLLLATQKEEEVKP